MGNNKDAGTQKVQEEQVVLRQINSKEAETKTDPVPKANIASTALKDVGKRLLKQYPHKDVMYVSADGTGFFSEDDAMRHANSLNDKIVVTVKR